MTTLMNENHIMTEQLPDFIEGNLINQWLYELVPEISLVKLITEYEIPICSYKGDEYHHQTKVRPRKFVTYTNKRNREFYYCNPDELVKWFDSVERTEQNYVNTSYCKIEDCSEELRCPVCDPPDKECDKCGAQIVFCSGCDDDEEKKCSKCEEELVCLSCDDINITTTKKRKRD